MGFLFGFRSIPATWWWGQHLEWMPLEVVCFDLGNGKRCVGTGHWALGSILKG